MSKDQRRKEREEREALRRADDRRRALDAKLGRNGYVSDLSGFPPAATATPNGSVPVGEPVEDHTYHPVPTVLLAITASVSIGLAVIGGTPVLGGGWDLVGAAPVLPALATGWFLYPRIALGSLAVRMVSAVVTVGIASAFILGATTQASVDGRPVRSGSVEDRSSRLATELLADLLTVEDNQRLLDLAPEQGRGVLGLYEQAAEQSAFIASKWNPVIRKDAPLPGFVEVFSLINQAGDLQARTLIAYRDDLNQPDAARQQQIAQSRQTIMGLLAGPNGAAAKLAATVAPIGITLTGGAS